MYPNIILARWREREREVGGIEGGREGERERERATIT